MFIKNVSNSYRIAKVVIKIIKKEESNIFVLLYRLIVTVKYSSVPRYWLAHCKI